MLRSKGETVGQVCRGTGVTEQTCYRRRKSYGGIRLEQTRRLKELEKNSWQSLSALRC